MTGDVHDTKGFDRSWQARTLTEQPLILPARHIILPQAVPGEEDAMARGALWVEVQPEGGLAFVAQCALGFAGKGVATGIWATPHPDLLLAVAGGYAYRIDTSAPEHSPLLPVRPVVRVYAAPEAGALVLTGFHHAYVLFKEDAWESPRLSWEGITVDRVEGHQVHGTGWHMRTALELPFTLNLRTREADGGAFLP